MSYMTSELRKKLQKTPKAELHVHLEGTVSRNTLLELSRRRFIAPASEVRLVSGTTFKLPATYFRNEIFQFNNFTEFAAVYLRITECLQQPEDILLVAKRYLESASEDGITLAEVYFSPSNYQLFGRDPVLLFDGLKEAQTLAARVFSIELKWIFDVVRNSPLDGAGTLDFALQARKKGVDVVALGLAGDEDYRGPEHYIEIFQEAESLGLTTLAHAGEGMTKSRAENVLNTVQLLHPKRIGHGIASVQLPEAIHAMKSNETIVEVCPWSNIGFGITSKTQHPIKTMIDAGLQVVIGSDDPGIFGRSLLDNYEVAHANGVSEDTLLQLAAQSLNFSSCVIKAN